MGAGGCGAAGGCWALLLAGPSSLENGGGKAGFVKGRRAGETGVRLGNGLLASSSRRNSWDRSGAASRERGLGPTFYPGLSNDFPVLCAVAQCLVWERKVFLQC